MAGDEETTDPGVTRPMGKSTLALEVAKLEAKAEIEKAKIESGTELAKIEADARGTLNWTLRWFALLVLFGMALFGGGTLFFKGAGVVLGTGSDELPSEVDGDHRDAEPEQKSED